MDSVSLMERQQEEGAGDAMTQRQNGTCQLPPHTDRPSNSRRVLANQLHWGKAANLGPV